MNELLMDYAYLYMNVFSPLICIFMWYMMYDVFILSAHIVDSRVRIFPTHHNNAASQGYRIQQFHFRRFLKVKDRFGG